MIDWMQNWATAGAKPPHCRWFGQMTLPQELTVREACLIKAPVRELEKYRGRGVVHRTIPVRPAYGTIRFRFILDRFSMEVFVNGGEQAASAALYTPQPAATITFEAEGLALIDVKKYEFNFEDKTEG